MAITFEQFRIVLGDADARKQIGLNLNEEEADLLQRNEARAISFFETWKQNGIVVTESRGAPPIVIVGLPWSGPAITGFVLSLIAGLSPIVQQSGVTFFLGFAALILSATGIGATKNGAKRGHGLAIAGTVISAIAFFGLLASALITSFHL